MGGEHPRSTTLRAAASAPELPVASTPDALLRKALDVAELGVIVTTVDGAIAYCNANAAALAGVVRDRLGQALSLRDVGGALLEAVAAASEGAHAIRGAVAVDVRLPTPGQPQPAVVECRVAAIVDEGVVVGTTCTLRDVTLERRSDESLREAAGRMQQAVRLAGLGIWDWDCEVDRVTWNDEMLRIYGVAREEFTGKGSDYFSFTHPDDRARQIENVRSAFSKGMTEDQLRSAREVTFDPKELRIVRRDGTMRVTVGDAVTVVDDAGRPVRMLGVTLDVTERRALEEQVRQSQKMDGIGQVAAGVAHDFNNLLAVISMCATALSARIDAASPLHDELDEVKSAAARAADLTRQLLAFGRRSVVFPRSVDVNALVATTRKMLSRVLGEHIELSVETCPGQLAVFADPGQIDQVLMNYAVNARDAMPRGGRLRITTSSVDAPETSASELAPGRYACISVADDGEGMSPEVTARIFEPFFTTKGVGHGTGLGLSTVYGIVKQAGGAIVVTSTPGKGTRFDTYLPATTAPVAEPPERHDEPPSELRGTVLLVEDDAAVRRTVRRMLEQNGYEVVEASSSSIALRSFPALADTIDVLLTDVVMPGLSGRELAQALSQQKPSLRVVFMSGYPNMHAPAAAPTAAKGTFLQKPFEETALLAALRG